MFVILDHTTDRYIKVSFRSTSQAILTLPATSVHHYQIRKTQKSSLILFRFLLPFSPS